MSFNTRAAAQSFGRRIRLKLKGKGWKYETWDNLGWHVQWTLGRLTLHYSRYSNKFSTLISDDDKCIGGAPHWSRTCSCEDPNEAVAADLKYALDITNDHLKGLKKIQRMIKAGAPKKKVAK